MTVSAFGWWLIGVGSCLAGLVVAQALARRAERRRRARRARARRGFVIPAGQEQIGDARWAGFAERPAGEGPYGS